MATRQEIKVMTIGHSIRPLAEFIKMLEAHGIKKVVDVRSIARSRHNPQFNKDLLPEALGKIGYIHLSGLGGLRHAKLNSVNKGWNNSSFRGFADYMQTEQFEENLQELIDLAGKKRVAIMCAEAVPWRCHRSLIADALTVRKVKVEHILSATNVKRHALTPFAKVKGTNITYPFSKSSQTPLPDLR
jgi:uncharacterized protein (DUF488 family)